MSALFKLNILSILYTSTILSQTLLEPITDNRFFQVQKLKSFIRSEKFSNIKQKFGDLLAVDAIYLKSLVICEYDIERALFISALATFDHRKINFKFPLLNFKLPIYLTLESENNFKRRVANLPSHIFSDSIEDKDKLQHFFLSAYLTYKNEGRKLPDLFGILVEKGEKIGLNLVEDPRDVMANRLGQEFGLALRRNPFALPSQFIRKGLKSD